MDFSFIIILLIIPFWIASIVNSRRSFKQLEHRKRPWKKLASDTQMRFVPAQYLVGTSRIEGVYRGFQMSISTYKRDKNYTTDTGTEIRLFMPDSFSYEPWDLPDISDVEHLLNRKKSILPYADRSLEFQGHEVVYREGQVRVNIDKLKAIIDYLCDLTLMYTRVIQLGGEAVPILQPVAVNDRNPLNAMAIRLLREIEAFTASEFASRLKEVRCRQCLHSFSLHKVELGFLSSIAYYACRHCKKSHSYYQGRSLILVLDNQMDDKRLRKHKLLYVNWFKRPKLFDFDEVIISQASDKEIAAFAIKIGNDTDAFRAERYSKMPCTVMESCDVSENTMHMLRRVFGRVQVKGAA